MNFTQRVAKARSIVKADLTKVLQFDNQGRPKVVSVPGSNAIEDTEYLYQVEVEDIDNDVFYFVYPD